jgi:exopolysaccharide production protein ExoQ
MVFTASPGPGSNRLWRLDTAVSCFLLVQTIGAFSIVDRTIYGEWDLKGGDKVSQALNLLGILAGAWLFWQAWQRARRFGTGGFLGLSTGAMLALATGTFLLASALWSIDPDTSLRRGVLYLLFLMGAIGLAGVLDGDEFMQILAVSCAIPALISLVLFAVHPASVTMAESGELRGVFSHKNVLGQVMAMGVLASLHGVRRGGGARLANAAMLLVCMVAAAASRSATSELVIALFCAVSVIVMLLRQGEAARMFGLALAAGLTLAALVTAVAPDMVFEMIGKDPTLTGRTELWAFVEFYIAQRPMLGWGLLAFWSAANPIAGQISASLGWTVPQAHNGLLEMLLEVGVVGTVFFSVLLVRNIMLALRCLRTTMRELGVSSLLCYGGIILIGITEDVMTDPGHAAVSVFFVTGFMCERALRMKARQAIPAPRGVLARGAPARF